MKENIKTRELDFAYFYSIVYTLNASTFALCVFGSEQNENDM